VGRQKIEIYYQQISMVFCHTLPFSHETNTHPKITPPPGVILFVSFTLIGM